MFSLPNFTYATLTNLNPRVEKHGDEGVSAVDLSISYDAPNTVLEDFMPGLLDAFYKEAEASGEQEEGEADRQERRRRRSSRREAAEEPSGKRRRK